MLNSTLKFAKKENRPKWILNGFLCIFKLIRMKAWLATCKPLILLDGSVNSFSQIGLQILA